MTKKIGSIKKQILEEIKPSEEEMEFISGKVREFKKKLENRLKTREINAQVFIGGSFAKGTLVRKKLYDVDIFVRFDKKHRKENLSDLIEVLLEDLDIERVHGSRDYFRIRISEKVLFEIVPVLKISKPEQAENVTDLSYFHVSYIKKIKERKILEDIMIAKRFCQANKCYGAESYIKGFSGYSLELLISYYKSFEKFLRECLKINDKKVIDREKHYRNKNLVMMNMNESKLKSPIILIDPTYKSRNALAALSAKTFKKFQKVARDFLDNPSVEFFYDKKIDLNEIKKESLNKGYYFIVLESKTDKQSGDIAGSKLYKFYEFLSNEIKKYFEIKNRGFNYNNKKSARYYFVLEKKEDILRKGPPLQKRLHSERFIKKHKNHYSSKGNLFAKEKINFSIEEFIVKWKRKNKTFMNEMSIIDLKEIKSF